jgi:hypothetical protein
MKSYGNRKNSSFYRRYADGCEISHKKIGHVFLIENRGNSAGSKIVSFEDATMERLHGRMVNEEAAV